MALSYPENTVWYIEARPWSGLKGDKPGFVQVDPVARGSGVVITFTKVPGSGEQPRSYILTCAHVVRNGKDELLEDIICYPPGKGFVRTAGNARRSGTFPDAEVLPATVSKFSPCQGEAGPRPPELKRNAAEDWVLLEIKDPSFYYQPSVTKLHNGIPFLDKRLRVIGFPFGAGLVAEKQRAELAGRTYSLFWKNGRVVRATVTKDFRPREHAEPGMIDYEGPEETRKGMSGSPVFDNDGSLVGIHRSSADAVMKRGGIRADAVARYLKSAYNMHFFSPSTISLAQSPGSTSSAPLELTISVNRITSSFGFKPIVGLKVGFEPLDYESMKGLAITGETDASGRAIIIFTPDNPNSDVFGYLTCLNEPAVLGEDKPFILTPHGKLTDDLTKEKVLRLPYRETLMCTVLGHKAYLEDYFVKFLSITDAVDDVDKKIADTAATAHLSKKEAELASERWLKRLKKERPVIRISNLQDFFPAEAPALLSIAESVGQVVQNGAMVSTSFLLAENLVLLPEFALMSSNPSDVKIVFPYSGQIDHRVVSTIILQNKELMYALCEIPRITRKSPMIGLGDIEKMETRQMKIAVLGFPSGDGLQGKELAMMPGETISRLNGLSSLSSEALVAHDARTSGGVAGGPVVDLQSNTVIAMHLGGKFTGSRKENFSVALQALWNDPLFVEVLDAYGVNVKTKKIE
ncbi:MAG: trypsin-like peptidase domain-containing protein [Planctomycetes bacterium]|nr:trypsin-like peptidase domain-containing protein [Planctomycetota bacterium]